MRMHFSLDNVDFDECSEGLHDCAYTATCTNTEGGYNCSCHFGYYGDGFTCNSKTDRQTPHDVISFCDLSDTDECGEETDSCHSDATCVDMEGSYYCVCSEGFIGNGTSCTGILSTHQCPQMVHVNACRC